ncbi:proline dehydrogenase family protein [Stieleria sp. ICT_E10.1]|uniref:bifunctional proline dehydrogenase/L-glutamate gamma-semialdehyde dehydrogenase n=1 Tax=Stieleria sedimenti TaxID=2976331 RepID=UPI0021803D7B|nr:proline dehydrogenase family protein [Stieleria sedimenti]MCS7471094.1 proline dehydrogenase family protein [Stieleria sedimenti]
MSDTPLDLATLLAIADDHFDDDADAAIEIAKALLLRSHALQTPQERHQQAELDRMISRPGDKATLVEMTDQAFRTHSPARVADQLTHILDVQGVPRFFSPLEQTMLRGFQTFGGYLPGVAVPLVKDKMRQETANVILPAEEQPLREHLAARQDSGVLMNVNFLGESLLGEDDANARLQNYLHALQIPEIACISVKLSTLLSQISTIARRHTVAVVSDRLELLYRAAARERFTRPDGTVSSKFVYLDMEEYRDLHLTADAFTETLGRPGLEQVRAGIALQAYIPDSFDVLTHLIEWSAARVRGGGVPITVRLVKGANMEMERVEASVGGWPQTPYTQKTQTDANFKRMLRSMIRAAADGHLLIGVASHNLFDIALAMLWGSRTQRRGVETNDALQATVLDRMQFEMLEGMANHQRRALFESAPRMLLYAPACRREDFINAIGYLIRRLDENTGKDNFLRYSFRLTPDSETWNRLADGFRDSLAMIDSVATAPRRSQDRRTPPSQPAAAANWRSYVNEPDTDWALTQHSEWAESIVADWKPRCDDAAERVPLNIAGQTRAPDAPSGSSDAPHGRVLRESMDPSRPGHAACRFTEATAQDVDDAIGCASDDPARWRQMSWDARYELFRKAAQNMRARRGELIGAMMIDGGKLISEADPEVSEAIDFTEFYPLTVRPYLQRAGRPGSPFSASPRETVAVISPWNFPLAIPCGGVVAALAAGNTVILKPASDTVLPAYRLAKCFWDAGVPETALQLVPCSGSGAGKRLVDDPRIDAVILTGGTETAKTMLRQRPELQLIAETGGKNATIVTSLSDRDLAIKHVLHSAFSHSGQKCSATSLLLLDQELYNDADFRNTLADAAESLPVGSVWDLSSRVGPLIRPPSGVLEQGIKELESGEEWLVMPRRIGDNRQLYRPGIKWNVRRGSFTHRTELFGPVLGVMSFTRLEEAIEMVNATGYGLTSGLESLDDREQRLWRDNIRAGNLYINRPTTGAIVLRQPFGGIGSSGYGPGAKAGGPHYVLPLMRLENTDSTKSNEDHDAAEKPPTTTETTSVDDALEAIGELDEDVIDIDRATRFATSAKRAAGQLIGTMHDHVRLVGQDNWRRYLPVGQLRVRLQENETADDLAVSMLAAAAAKCPVTYSLCNESSDLVPVLESISEHLIDNAVSSWRCEWVQESDEALAEEISDGRVDRLRVLTATKQLPMLLHDACRQAFISIIAEPVVDDAEIEMLRYLNEQSISHDYHRYGNLGRRQPVA